MEKTLNHIREQLLSNGEFMVPALGRYFLQGYSSSANKFTKDARLRGSTIHFEHNEDQKVKGEIPDFIQLFSKDVLEGLNRNKTFSAGFLGNFFINSSKQITFLASPKINLSTDTFGFTQVKADEYKKDWLDWLSDPEEDGTIQKGELNVPPKENKESQIPSSSKQSSKKTPPLKKQKEQKAINETNKSVLKPEQKKEERPSERKIDKKIVPAMEPSVKSTESLPDKKKSRLGLKIVASLIFICLAGLSIYYAQYYAQYYAAENLKVQAIPNDNGVNETNEPTVEGSTTAEQIEVEKQKATSLIRAESNRISKENLLKFSLMPGEFYIVGNTFLRENTALSECSRWMSLGQSNAACAQTEGSQMYKVILGRFEYEKDAQVFIDDMVLLDSLPVSIEPLKIRYPD